MRLIDADALIKKFDKKLLDALIQSRTRRSGETLHYGISVGMIFARNVTSVQPTVDAVPVVRCKDCKHRGMEGACPKCFEVYVDDDWYDWYTIDNAKDEGFCDRGERWDENAAD